jgi:hypothetical protein
MSVVVLTEDLWSALDALDAVPEAQQTEWYKRLVEAADAASEVLNDLREPLKYTDSLHRVEKNLRRYAVWK